MSKKNDIPTMDMEQFIEKFMKFRSEILKQSKKYDTSIPPISSAEEIDLFKFWFLDTRETEVFNEVRRDEEEPDESDRWKVEDEDNE